MANMSAARVKDAWRTNRTSEKDGPIFNAMGVSRAQRIGIVQAIEDAHANTPAADVAIGPTGAFATHRLRMKDAAETAYGQTMSGAQFNAWYRLYCNAKDGEG